MKSNQSSSDNGTLQSDEATQPFAQLAKQLLAHGLEFPGQGLVVGITGSVSRESIKSVVEGIAISASQIGSRDVLIIDLTMSEHAIGIAGNRSGASRNDENSLLSNTKLGRSTAFDRLFHSDGSSLLLASSLNGSIGDETMALGQCRDHFALTLLTLPSFASLQSVGGWLTELDQALVVLKSGSTTLRVAEQGIAQLRNAGVTILGSVLIDAS